MALPTFERTYTITTATGGNNAYADQDNLETYIMLKNLLVASGHWTVIGSSTQSAYSMDGTDRWITYADIDYQYEWIVLENTNLGPTGHFQIRIKCASGSQYSEGANLAVSPSGLYTAVSSSSVTATDEINIATNFLGLSGSSPLGTRNVWLWTSSDGRMFRSMVKCWGTTITGKMLQIDVVADTKTAWTDNWIVGSVTPTIALLKGGLHNWICNLDGVTTSLRITGEGNNSGYLVEQTNYQSVDLNGEWFYMPISGLVSTNIRRSGLWGRPIDMFVAPPVIPQGTAFPDTGIITHIKYGDLVVPWDNSLPLPLP